jgi:Bifunctional DNA primase/polymerase, N-terminal/Primase C terminal 2 (PriCT-2)
MNPSAAAENCNCYFEAALAKLNATDIQLFIGPRGAKPQLSGATRAAIKTYEQSGRMLDAALTYAAHGFPVFPLTIRKTPVPKRDPDPTGKFEDGIPGTGSFYKATTDPIQIKKWWTGHEYLIGLPMGRVSGVWCLDVDTSEDHADGVAGWNDTITQHEPIVTREHRSATGGPHLIFNWSAEQPLHCSSGALPDGISVKGEGGYIVVPPSRRKKRSYTVHTDIDPTDAPAWLVDKILQGRSPQTSYSSSDPVAADFDELFEALSFIPNDDVGRDKWAAMGLRIFAATGGDPRGLEAFATWSEKSEKCHGGYVERWQGMQGSPPDRTGAEKIFKMAREHGWVQGLRQAPPTYSVEGACNVDAARREVQKLAREFLERVAVPESERNVWIDFYFENGPLLIVWAIPIPTGVGKTQITIAQLAAWLRTVKIKGPIIYAVPRHKLGDKIEEQFTQHGINARVFRGREAIDPSDETTMCLNLDAVELAKRARADIAKSCCSDGKKFCRFFDSCGYQRQQLDAEAVQVWIVAADMLFHTQKVFGEPAAVIIDEAFWAKGIRGVEHEACSVPLASLDWFGSGLTDRDFLRDRLRQALEQQANGPVSRQQLAAMLMEEECTRAISLEWAAMPKIEIKPGMSEAAIKALHSAETIDAIQHSRRVIRIFAAARELLQSPEIEQSGRLRLKTKNGQRVLEWRGVAPISDQFEVPTLLLDATLPDPSLLQVYHPEVQVVADIKVAMPPHVHVRQVLRAPTSSSKLNNDKHLDEVRRYALQRWMETGRQSTLIICQMKVDHWLAGSGLPQGITVEHYNDVSGLDDYRDVRLLVLVGRTAPGPGAIETMAAALSGAQPVACSSAGGGFAWYPRVKGGIRLADGRGIETKGDRHPDDFVEAVRWQVHEAELVQAIGRARGINRTEATPLDIHLLFDTPLPITVNEVVIWSAPNLLIETAVDGVMLTSPGDMVKVWPKLWSNPKAAYRTVQQRVPVLPGFVQVTYQLKGPKMKPRQAYFDRTLVPDPETWLREWLGPLDLL